MAFAAARGSSAVQIADTTQMPRSGASRSAGARSAVIPPIATAGSPNLCGDGRQGGGALGADPRGCALLGRRVVHRTDAHEVDERGSRRLVAQGAGDGELGGAAGGQPDERVRAQDRADVLDRFVGLAHVDVDVEALGAK